MPTIDKSFDHIRLISDADIAQLTSMSRSWVRKQRWCRRHRLSHVFDVGPVMIGSVPRYRLDAVLEWIEAQSTSSAQERAGGVA